MKIKASGPGYGSSNNEKNAQQRAEQMQSVENAKYLASTPHFREKLQEEEGQVQNVRLIFNNL